MRYFLMVGALCLFIISSCSQGRRSDLSEEGALERKCKIDEDCGGQGVCDSESEICRECVMNPVPRGCLTGKMCHNFRCVECVSDSDCTGSMPEKCSSDFKCIEVITGAWCGLEIQNREDRNSILINGEAEEAFIIPCLGSFPGTSCPEGYSQLKVKVKKTADDGDADLLFTCIEESGTPKPLPSQGRWCGIAIHNQGSHTSIRLVEKTAADPIFSGTHDPTVSCPGGQVRLRVKFRNYWADSQADRFDTCVETGSENTHSKTIPSGTWCGLSMGNSGLSSIFFRDSDEAATVNCFDANPSSSCPEGFEKLRLKTTVKSNDPISDTLFTCIKK